MGLPNRTQYLSRVKSELSKKWPDNRAIRIVCHGHSVPSGYFKTPKVVTFGAYPHLLHVGLKRKYPYSVINVITTAIGGECALSGAKRFARDVLSLKPDVITLDYSLNDRGKDMHEVKKAWTAMIVAAKKAGCKVILLTPTGDSNENLLDPAALICRHAVQVKTLASQYSVGLADSLKGYQLLASRKRRIDSWLSQFNHPNEKGHAWVAKELLRWF